MAKLSKQDKIEIYHLWHDYQVGPTELSQRYQVSKSNIDYLLALINRHGLAILDQPYTTYTSNFKERALKRTIVDHESLYHVALALGLKSFGCCTIGYENIVKMGIISLISKEEDRSMTKRE